MFKRTKVNIFNYFTLIYFIYMYYTGLTCFLTPRVIIALAAFAH